MRVCVYVSGWMGGRVGWRKENVGDTDMYRHCVGILVGRKIETIHIHTHTYTHHVEIIVVVGIEGLWWVVRVIYIHL